jgi:hypothetical protein
MYCLPKAEQLNSVSCLLAFFCFKKIGLRTEDLVVIRGEGQMKNIGGIAGLGFQNSTLFFNIIAK